MSEWVRTLLHAALFREHVFSDLSRRRDAFLQGVVIVLVVGLVVGLPGLIRDIVVGLRPATTEVEMAEVRTELNRLLEQMQPFFGNMPAEEMNALMAQIEENMQFGLAIAGKVEAMPTMLPKPLDRSFQAIGTWTSKPFAGSSLPLGAAALGTWLGYGTWVMLFAKLLGGRGSLVGFFGATAFYAVPHLLNVLGLVPVLGGVLSVIAYFWGLALYVKGTAVSHQLSVERALLAVLLPALIALVILIILATGVATLIAIAISGAAP